MTGLLKKDDFFRSATGPAGPVGATGAAKTSNECAASWAGVQDGSGMSRLKQYQELALAMAQAEMQNAINDSGLRRTNIAKILGVSRPFITKIMRGDYNLTVKATHLLYGNRVSCHGDVRPGISHDWKCDVMVERLALLPLDIETLVSLQPVEAFRVLRRYVPGVDKVGRPLEMRAQVKSDGSLKIWSVYTDDEGGTLSRVLLDREAYRALFSYLLVHPNENIDALPREP